MKFLKQSLFRTLLIVVINIFFKTYFGFFGKSKISKNLQRTLNLYQKGGFAQEFGLIRAWDAPYVEVEKLIPKKGKIVDLGCGEGIFTNFLAVSSPKRKIFSVEIDRKRLALADRELKNVSVSFGNAVTYKPKDADCIILFHVLHHLSSYEDQVKVLNNCRKGLKRNGKLIIVEVDIKPSFKYFLSWATDHFLVPILFEKRFYSPIYFRKRQDWTSLLKEMSFKVKWKNVSKRKPFSHSLFVATCCG